MAIVGIDLGNYNVKTSEGDIFPARYASEGNILGNDKNVLEYEGIKYYIKSGKFENNYDKASKETNLILLLYALAIQNESCFKVVVGLPALSYKTNKEIFKNRLLENKLYKVKINSIEKTILIDDLIVFPEGAGTYYSINKRDKNAIIIDIGGGTTNIIEFKSGKLKDCTTLGAGMIQIYSKVRDYLNASYTLKLELEDIEEYLREGLKVEGVEISWEFFTEIKKAYIRDLINELRNFSYKTSTIYLAGGGSKILKADLCKVIKGVAHVDNYIFANAEGFKKVGVSKWQEKE